MGTSHAVETRVHGSVGRPRTSETGVQGGMGTFRTTETGRLNGMGTFPLTETISPKQYESSSCKWLIFNYLQRGISMGPN